MLGDEAESSVVIDVVVELDKLKAYCGNDQHINLCTCHSTDRNDSSTNLSRQPQCDSFMNKYYGSQG
jgi:hypothetical protein